MHAFRVTPQSQSMFESVFLPKYFLGCCVFPIRMSGQTKQHCQFSLVFISSCKVSSVGFYFISISIMRRIGLGAMKHGHLLFRLRIYKLIWRKRVFKISKTKLPGATDMKTHEDTSISLQFLFCRNPIPVASLFTLHKSSSLFQLAQIYLSRTRVKQTIPGICLISEIVR